MAISPPSDILLDVANAADPAQVRVATARLAKLAADPSVPDADFTKALTMAARDGKAMASASPLRPTIGTESPSRQPTAKDAKAAYQKFEAILLQSFVESMLPKDDELYGDKESATVYRSMMAEQFANQLAKAGGIGIAKSIADKHPASSEPVPPVAGVKPAGVIG